MAQHSNRINLRVSDLEKADWRKAAGGDRLVSSWLRSLANAECERLRGEQDASLQPGRVAELADAPASSPGASERAGSTPAAPTECPRAHHHRPGRYCGACKKVATKVGE